MLPWHITILHIAAGILALAFFVWVLRIIRITKETLVKERDEALSILAGTHTRALFALEAKEGFLYREFVLPIDDLEKGKEINAIHQGVYIKNIVHVNAVAEEGHKKELEKYPLCRYLIIARHPETFGRREIRKISKTTGKQKEGQPENACSCA